MHILIGVSVVVFALFSGTTTLLKEQTANTFPGRLQYGGRIILTLIGTIGTGLIGFGIIVRAITFTPTTFNTTWIAQELATQETIIASRSLLIRQSESVSDTMWVIEIEPRLDYGYSRPLRLSVAINRDLWDHLYIGEYAQYRAGFLIYQRPLRSPGWHAYSVVPDSSRAELLP